MVFSFNTTTREVLEQVVREPRFQALTRLPILPPMEIALGLAAFALFAAGTSLYIAGTIPFLLMVAMNSFAIYTSFTPLHDATHRSVSRSRPINDLIGTICCLLLLPGITTRIYRYLHLEHHRYAGNPSKDPDEAFVSAPPWALPFILAGLDVHWSWWYCTHWNSRPMGERLEFVAGLTFYIGLHITFLTSAYALEFFLCFMIPQRLGLFYVAWFFAHIQHPAGVEWEHAPFQTTVRVRTSRLGRWLLLGQAHHCLHHLAPSIPYYRYKQAWDLGEHLFAQQQIPTRTLWRQSQDLNLPQKLAAGDQTKLTARVASVAEVADGINAYDLVPANGAVWPRFEAGAHIDVHLYAGDAGDAGHVRQYSLCNAPTDQQLYRIAVKLEPQGSGGSIGMHEQVLPGCELTISAPRNNFLRRKDFSHYVLIAGGIGLTPLLAMAHEIHTAQLTCDQTFELHVFAQRPSAIAFHQQLAGLPFADSIILHCNEPDRSARSRINEAIPTFKTNHGMYICGPTEFMAHTLSVAETNSWPSGQLFSETFVPAKTASTDNQPFKVQLASTGEVLTVAADEQLIDVLHNNGYMVMCSCTQGICGSCITPVIQGVPEHRDAIMSDAQRATNNAMTVCVSRARSERLVLDL